MPNVYIYIYIYSNIDTYNAEREGQRDAALPGRRQPSGPARVVVAVVVVVVVGSSSSSSSSSSSM